MPYQIKNGIIYSGNAVTLTQAQYDALTTAEKNNGTVYYIYDSDAMVEAQEVGLDGGNVETLAGSVATFESSPSTTVHAEGEYILYQAQLYKVTSAIAVGEDLTVGSNIEATNLGNELNAGLTEINEYSVPFRNGSVYFKRIGLLKQVRFQLEIPSDISTGTMWFVLPEEYRPSYSTADQIVDFACVQTSGTFAGIVRFSMNGNVTNEFRAFKAGSVRATFMYI